MKIFRHFLQRAQGRAAREVRNVGMWLAQYRDHAPVRSLAAYASAFDNGLQNVGFNVRRNGELRLIRSLPLYEGAVVFDVGANVGHYSELIRKTWSGVQIHAFEPNPLSYERFVARNEGVTAINAGLSDQDGVLDLWIGGRTEVDAAATLHRRPGDDRYRRSIPIPS